MRDWIFWTLLGFAALQFLMIAVIQSTVIDIQGRLKVIAERLYPQFPVMKD